MSDTPGPPPEVSPPEAKAEQSPGWPSGPVIRLDGASTDDAFIIAPRALAAGQVRPHARRRGEPLYRRLRIFALDPTVSRLEGAITTLSVPYEPLGPGPTGAMFEVLDFDDDRGRHYDAVDLEDPFVLMEDGCAPSAADPYFHQQMVYAVATRVYFAFKLALGRDLSWGFDSSLGTRLRLRPHAFAGQNAYYNRAGREVAFGYFPNDPRIVQGRNVPGGTTFTCLSHDVVAHETTHALLDGLRANFMIATGPDVLAFHEAFADLIAIFLHFQYPELVKAALRHCRGDLRQPSMLTDLAQQFGQTTGAGRALRFAIDELKSGEASLYDRAKPSHELGGVLVAAVYDAFAMVFHRKSSRARRLVSSGTGILREGELDADLLGELADVAKKLATNFLNVCIRAVDYCPAVDIEFGEYLRAMITADGDLVPDDPWGYREALIDAFRRRRIYPTGVPNLSEEALRWDAAPTGLCIPALHFKRLRFAGDPATAASPKELRRQARAVGRAIVASDESRAAFGIAPADTAGVEQPQVESIRSLRRVGPDSQVVFDLVAEITQVRWVPLGSEGPPVPFLGGATIVIGPEGNVRHIIYKRVTSDRRLQEQRTFMSAAGGGYWKQDPRGWQPIAAPFKLLHIPPGSAHD